MPKQTGLRDPRGPPAKGTTQRMKITLLSVGRDRSGLFEPGVQEYAGRLGHYCRFTLVELPEAGKSQGVAQAIEDEGRRILEKLRPGERLVALDEHGKSMTTDAFAQWLGRQQDAGAGVVFCVGGANGLSQAVKSRADLLLSLSAFTMPHRLARLVAAEQLYRAFTVLKGEPYHRS